MTNTTFFQPSFDGILSNDGLVSDYMIFVYVVNIITDSEIICESDDHNDVHEFARKVTNRTLTRVIWLRLTDEIIWLFIAAATAVHSHSSNK